MTAQAKSILQAALALPEADRAELAERLFDSLSNDLDAVTEDELAAELDRRRAEFEQGKTQLIPWSEFRFKL